MTDGSQALCRIEFDGQPLAARTSPGRVIRAGSATEGSMIPPENIGDFVIGLAKKHSIPLQVLD